MQILIGVDPVKTGLGCEGVMSQANIISLAKSIRVLDGFVADKKESSLELASPFPSRPKTYI